MDSAESLRGNRGQVAEPNAKPRQSFQKSLNRSGAARIRPPELSVRLPWGAGVSCGFQATARRQALVNRAKLRTPVWVERYPEGGDRGTLDQAILELSPLPP